MSRNNLINSLHDFLLTLETCFAPSYYDEPHGALFKLTQTGTINNYLHEFECIANHIVRLTHPYLLSCFVSDLYRKYDEKSKLSNLYHCHKHYPCQNPGRQNQWSPPRFPIKNHFPL